MPRGGPRWTCLLGSWLVATGCVRYQHIRRPTVRRASPTVFHGHCRKGKQPHARGGFDWCAPTGFASGFNWAPAWIKLWKSLSPVAQKSSGICFDGRGTPWNIAEVQHMCQDTFSTTYAWRRMLPTVGHLLRMPSPDLCSLGTGRTGQRSRLKLGWRCTTSARYAQSAVRVTDFRPGRLPRDGQRQARLVYSEVKDKETLFAAQPTKESLKTHLQFSRAGTAAMSATKIRDSAHGPAVSMPDAIRGRVLTGFLKDGRRLCGAFQQPSGCDEGEEVCRNASSPGTGVWRPPWSLCLRREEVSEG